MKESERILEIIRRLETTYPDAECSLNFKTPFELMIATILSAQCTDKRVNEVTPELFAKYPDANAMAAAKLESIEKLIQSTGFFRQKAKSLKHSSEILVEKHKGEPPKKIEELVKLPGVGRKTANVLLGNAYGVASGVVVDTHVRRISQLLGLTQQNDPVKIELDLNKKIPEPYWVEFPHWLIHHGRAICVARRPKCLECPLLSVCPRKGLPKLQKPASAYELQEDGEMRPSLSKSRKPSRAIRAKNR